MWLVARAGGSVLNVLAGRRPEAVLPPEAFQSLPQLAGALHKAPRESAGRGALLRATSRTCPTNIRSGSDAGRCRCPFPGFPRHLEAKQAATAALSASFRALNQGEGPAKATYNEIL